MDPSTMDFMMHPPEHVSPPSSSVNVDHIARSACPALRAAAAEHNQHPQSMFPPRPNYYFDPVHNGPTFWQNLPPPHARWASDPPPFQPSPPVMPLTTGQMNQPPYQPNGPNLYNPHHNQAQFRYRTPLLSLQRIGGTAPIQHSQGGFSGSNQSQPQAGSPGEAGPNASAHGPRANLPSLNSLPPTTNQSLQATFTQTPHSAQQSSQHNLAFTRHNIPPPFVNSDVPAPSSEPANYGSSNSSNSASSSPPRRAPGGSRTSDMSNETASSESRRAGTTRTRRAAIPVLPPRLSSESGWSSDDDSEPDPSAIQFLEASGGGAPGAENGSDERLRTHQIIRGTISNKRVASKKAITSLESVAISTLPENERTCVICYNDYGVETPEGINETPLRLPKCKHVFGDHCIKKWFEESDSCPYCRDKVPSEPQFRHAMHAHNVYRFLRQHSQATMHMRNVREHERSDSDSLGRSADTMLNGFAALATSPFPDTQYIGVNGTSRRQDNPTAYNSRTPAWHGNLGGDRHSPLPFSEVDNRRRQYPWIARPDANHSHSRQHSTSSNSTARQAFDANVPPFGFHPQMGGTPPESYLNPLNMAGSGSTGDDYPTLPHIRSQHVAPLSPTYPGPEVYMSNADEPMYGGAISHQQS
ncbi:hypothetical protein F5Y11DRAFT_98754 [Daldinia sp. FL1419]|nr:hypothetical protein F5Y11DRAFT_98754 [Daldinia sp. FL1419]